MPPRFSKEVKTMTIYKIDYTLNPRTVLSKKTTEGVNLPEVLFKALRSRIPCERVMLLAQSYNALCVLVCAKAPLSETTLEKINDSIAEQAETGNITIAVSETDAANALSDERLCAEDKAYLTAINNGETPPAAPKQPAEEKHAPETNEKTETQPDIFETVEGLIAMDEFKAWAKEMQAVAQKAFDQKLLSQSLMRMSYLVSVNSGCGRTTMLRAMGDVLARVLGKTKTVLHEICIEPEPDTKDYNIEKAIQEFDYAGKDKTKLHLFALHADKLQNNLHINAWLRLLTGIREHNQNGIYVFVLPYLESGVLYEMHERIADILPNRILTAKPLTNQEYTRFFELYFEKLDISVTEGARLAVPEKIAEEKSDGRFYGINTIHKICDEILYNKLKAAAQTDGDTLEKVTKADVQALMHKPLLTGENEWTGLQKLDSLISLHNVKTLIREILATIKMQRSMDAGKRNALHMMFSGAPGTGKTVVARILGEILREEKILSVGGFYEVTRKDLVGQYVGHTAPKTAEVCRAAYGSVLFIDEAYMLDGGDANDFGKEAISTLIAEMENKRDDFVVIFAGYERELERLFALNPGLRDRIPYKIPFMNYDRTELEQIFYKMLPAEFEFDGEFKAAAHDFFTNLTEDLMQDPNFSNARFVRNLVERILSKAALRMQMEENADGKLRFVKSDFNLASADAEFKKLNEKKKVNKIGFSI